MACIDGLQLLYMYRPHFPRPTRAGCPLRNNFVLYPSTYVRPPYPESREVIHYLAVNVTVSRSAFSLVPAAECCREYYRRGLTHTHTSTPTRIHTFTHTHTHTHTHLYLRPYAHSHTHHNTSTLLSFGRLSNDGASVTRHTGLGKKREKTRMSIVWQSWKKKRKKPRTIYQY